MFRKNRKANRKDHRKGFIGGLKDRKRKADRVKLDAEIMRDYEFLMVKDN